MLRKVLAVTLALLGVASATFSNGTCGDVAVQQNFDV